MEAPELIDRCKAGDSHALHQLYQQYRAQLLNICKQYTNEDSVAEDLLHDAFVVILTSLNQLREADKLVSWMTSIVRNVGFHYRKHLNKEQAALHQIVSEELITEETTQMPDYDQLQSLVTQLPEGYQQVFRLYIFEGMSHLEISQLLGIAPHSSSSQLSHAKRMLQALIRQSWVLILLLIAIPTAIWKLLHKPEAEVKPTATAPKPQEPKPEPVIETPHDKPVYAFVDKKPSTYPIHYQTEAVILPDSIPYHIHEKSDTLKEITQASKQEEPTSDTLIYQQIPLPSPDDTRLNAVTKPKQSSWNITLAYSGQVGRASHDVNTFSDEDIHMINALFSNGTGAIPIDDPNTPLNNWTDLNNYLIENTSWDLETRSKVYVAAQNILHKETEEGEYHHKLPFNIQLLLSHQLTKKLSIETGLSYTQLESTTTLGSQRAWIYEQQRIRYLGIPLKFGWQWYSKAHLSLYSSAGAMLELPIFRKLNMNHFADDTILFNKETAPSVPCQWSTTIGLGVEYDFTPHIGFYVEPSLQYFFDNGSDLKTYRTEHPIQVTLPLGIRFHW